MVGRASIVLSWNSSLLFRCLSASRNVSACSARSLARKKIIKRKLAPLLVWLRLRVHSQVSDYVLVLQDQSKLYQKLSDFAPDPQDRWYVPVPRLRALFYFNQPN